MRNMYDDRNAPMSEQSIPASLMSVNRSQVSIDRYVELHRYTVDRNIILTFVD
jgi:hypothetical protein